MHTDSADSSVVLRDNLAYQSTTDVHQPMEKDLGDPMSYSTNQNGEVTKTKIINENDLESGAKCQSAHSHDSRQISDISEDNDIIHGMASIT